MSRKTPERTRIEMAPGRHELCGTGAVFYLPSLICTWQNTWRRRARHGEGGTWKKAGMGGILSIRFPEGTAHTDHRERRYEKRTVMMASAASDRQCIGLFTVVLGRRRYGANLFMRVEEGDLHGGNIPGFSRRKTQSGGGIRTTVLYAIWRGRDSHLFLVQENLTGNPLL